MKAARTCEMAIRDDAWRIDAPTKNGECQTELAFQR